MAKRDKNRSYMEWEYEWEENVREEENRKNRKNREKERRAKKLQSNKYTTDDWDDID